MSTVSGKVVVITGASAGIGATLAVALLKAGAYVALAARTVEKMNEVAASAGVEADKYLIQQCDVTKRGDHEALLAATVAKFGKVDSWINNAGLGNVKRVLELQDSDVDHMMTINVKSVLYGMQTVMPHFKERREGQVINVGSLLGRIPLASVRSMYRYTVIRYRY
jgi:NADP-dependent 3-hydroxy acid dehydrogenase YdfG